MCRTAMFCLLTIAASACSAPVRDYHCAIEPEREPAAIDVHSMWSCNRDVLRRAAGRKAFSMREFHAAAQFFESVTGLQVDTRWTHLGGVPGSDLRQDLQALDVWYATNRDKLRWDAGLGLVVYEGLAAPDGAF